MALISCDGVENIGLVVGEGGIQHHLLLNRKNLCKNQIFNIIIEQSHLPLIGLIKYSRGKHARYCLYLLLDHDAFIYIVYEFMSIYRWKHDIALVCF